MKKSFHLAPAAFAVLTACFLVSAFSVRVRAAEEAPTAADVEDARRCAAETRAAGHAFADVRDSVRASQTSRAESQLTAAEDSLQNARSACRGNPDISAQLELLAGESESLRRSLGAPAR